MSITYHFSSKTISLYFKYSEASMPSTCKSSPFTLTNSQKPGLGLTAKATYGGTTAASCTQYQFVPKVSLVLSITVF